MSLVFPGTVTDIRPSYARGFAPRNGLPEYPGLRKGLVGHWDPSLGATGLTLFDWAGRKNNGTLTNMDPATDWVMSPYGWALNLDGSNDEVRITNAAVLNPTAAMSIRVIYKTGSDLSNRVIIRKRLVGGPPYYQYTLTYYSAGKIAFACAPAGSDNSATSSVALVANTWYDFVGTYDGANIRIYENGSLSAETADTGLLTVGTEDLVIAEVTGYQDPADGQIALAALWSRALAPSEIQQLYADPHALTRLQERVFAAAAAPAGVAPTSHLYGSLVGPLGGAV